MTKVDENTATWIRWIQIRNALERGDDLSDAQRRELLEVAGQLTRGESVKLPRRRKDARTEKNDKIAQEIFNEIQSGEAQKAAKLDAAESQIERISTAKAQQAVASFKRFMDLWSRIDGGR